MTLLTSLNPVKNWSGMLVNQRITGGTLLLMMGTWVAGHCNQMIAAGYTCVGSSNGVVAALDTVNRCTTAAGFAVRAANTTTAQSWIVLSDGTTQTLVTYTGATDDVARVSCSPGSLFTIAGTATFAPTATDELVMTTGLTLIGTTVGVDRLYNVWVDSTHKHWRSCIVSAGVLVGRLLGVEPFDTSPLSGPTCVPAVWGFSHTGSNTGSLSNLLSAYGVGTSGGLCRTSGNAQTQLGGSCLLLNGSFTNDEGVLLTANGSQFALRSMGCASTSTGCVGLVGIRIDWWASSDKQACGALGGPTGKEWVLLNGTASAGAQVGVLWPWPNTVASMITS